MKRIGYVVVLCIAFAACKDKSNFTVEGTFKNAAAGSKVYLFGLQKDQAKPLDSTVFSDKGEFKFSHSTPAVDFFRISAGHSEYMIIAKNGDQIKIEADLADKNLSYSIYGAAEADKLEELNKTKNQYMVKIGEIQHKFDEAVTAQRSNNNISNNPLIVRAKQPDSGPATDSKDQPVQVKTDPVLIVPGLNNGAVASAEAGPVAETPVKTDPPRSFQEFLDAEVKTNPALAQTKTIAEKGDKWEMGLVVAPSIGNSKKLNMGYGVSMAYALSDKVSISSGSRVSRPTRPTVLRSAGIGDPASPPGRRGARERGRSPVGTVETHPKLPSVATARGVRSAAGPL